MRNEVGRSNTCYIHVTLLPYLGATGELKTKPTQHSVQMLRGMGIQPDVIVCRADHPMEDSVRDKISLHCDVPVGNVIGLPTLDNVYESPLVLEDQGLGRILETSVDLPSVEPDMSLWRNVVDLAKEPGPELEIAVVGKYVDLHDSYISVREALYHAGLHHQRDITVHWVAAEHVEEEGPDKLLATVSGIVVPGGFGDRGIEGMIETARYARVKPGAVPGAVSRNAGNGDRIRPRGTRPRSRPTHRSSIPGHLTP